MSGFPYADIVDRLTGRYGVVCGPGLTAAELGQAEARYGIQFPTQLRDFLAAGLPSTFYPWRSTDPAAIDLIESALAGPLDGLIFSFTHDRLWFPAWGERPATASAVAAVIRREYAAAARLVPVTGHRFMPCLDGPGPTPVLSVHGADIICYGADLATYLDNEYGPQTGAITVNNVPPIPFWDIFLNDYPIVVDDEDHPGGR